MLPSLSALPVLEDSSEKSVESEKKSKSAPLGATPAMSRLSGRISQKLAPVKSVLYQRVSVTSAAGASIASVVSLTPAGSAEFATYAALFDEVIVDSVNFLTSYQIQSTAAGPQFIFALQVFDPADFSVPSSIITMLPAAQRQKNPLVLSTSAAGISDGHIVPVNQDGWVKWLARVPPGSMRASALATLYGHEWSPTAEATDLYGVLKTFIEAPAALTFTTYTTFIQYNVRFRSRA